VAVHKLTNPRIFLAQFNVTADHSSIRVNTSAEALDATKFGDSTRVNLGGLLNHTLEGEFFQDYGDGLIEDVLRVQLGASGGTVYTTTPEGGAVGEEAFFGRTLVTSHDPMGGTVGDIHKGSFSGVAANGYPCIKGQLFKAPGATTATGTSTPVESGAVAAGKRVFASLHVLSASGTSPTLDVVVQSDDAEAFTDPTARITLAQATGVTSAFASAAGAITDTWWRISYTIGGTDTPTFSFVVAVGIK